MKVEFHFDFGSPNAYLAHHGIDDFQPNPHFPVNTLQIMRGAIVAERAGFLERYVDELFFGKDRLEDVEREILRQRADRG